MKLAIALTLLASASSVFALADADAHIARRGVNQHAHHRHRARDAKAERRSTLELQKRQVDVVYTYVTVIVDAQGNTIVPDTPAAPTSAAPASVEPVSTAAPIEPTTAAIESSSIYIASTSVPAVVDVPVTSAAPEPAPTSVEPTSEYVPPSTTSVYVAPSSTFAVSTTTAAASSTSESAQPSSTSSGSYPISGDVLGLYQNPTVPFEDGVVPCSTFPSGQGVISLDWLNLGGWSGIQLSDASLAGQGTSCQEGNLCSYACQAGMAKTQWPSSQPSSGESRGGLMCQNGYLVRTNTDTDYLCEWGIDSAQVVSELDSSVAICQTDYPGTENMVIPTEVSAGSTEPLTVIDQDTYYKWQGLPTSAQFYVNNAGVSVADGCVWGTASAGVGNYAPLNFGAGYAAGVSYLSLLPNPNNKTPLNFNVKIVASDGAVINGDCTYENGVFSGGANGCTVAVTSGVANFVLYN
ncbi:hypothetical protein V1512DRAFT_263542 [Lipomyces arxii]|uniref:uncharacterized protein n=1 Tax=Lipomyces arxii TaxID=56418 RepID=UPI0034CEFF57